MNKANESGFSEDLIRVELARVLESPIFAQSERLGRFLRFAVEHAMSGSEEGLKEYVIGTEVYDRKPPYHPSQDSIVRTEARRLRTKLKEYYESKGKGRPNFHLFSTWQLHSRVPAKGNRLLPGNRSRRPRRTGFRRRGRDPRGSHSFSRCIWTGAFL